MHPDLQALARRFLDFVYRETRLPMIVCDERGLIVQAVDRKRVGTPHAFAQRILGGEADELFVTAEDAARDPRMKEGCNCAITVDGERVGTFGLAGPIELARPLTRIASAVIASWIKEHRQQAALRRAADTVLAGVRDVSGRAEGAAVQSAEVVELMGVASREAAHKAERTDAVVKSVQEIAQKSRILSINGSVEAARAGETGRGFAVVAREMLALAEDARGAANEIQSTLQQVRRAIGQLQDAIGRSATLTEEQTAALVEVRAVAEGLQRAVSEAARAGAQA